MLNEQMQRIVLGIVTTFLAGFPGCVGAGCTKVKSLGVASDPPVIELKVPGAELTVRPISVEFYDETVEP